MSADKNRIQWPGWKTVRLIGRGSFGEVYEIERDVLGDLEKAALKVITIPQSESEIDEMYSDGYDQESITSRFKSHLKSIVAEYSTMRKLNGNTNIIHCDDVRYVQHDDGIGWDIYIKMELLTPLTKALPREVPEKIVVKIAMDLCTALEICKRYDIIHRDIKPQNIFVSSGGDYKLGDFGIAKTVEKTMGGTKIGTYKYMAPEVYNNKPYGSAADLYSLGMVLYWLLNERRMPFLPLPPEKPTAAMEEEARNRRLSGEPFAEPRNGSRELKAIVMKACASRVEDRYASASAMLQDLRQLGQTSSGNAIVHGMVSQETLDAEEEFPTQQEDALTVLTGKAEQPASEQKQAAGPRAARKKRKSFKPAIITATAAAVLILVLALLLPGLKRENPDDQTMHQMQEPQTPETMEQTVTVPKHTEAVELAPIIAVDAAGTHIAALRADGTVSVVMEDGRNHGQGDTSEWSDIVSICAGYYHTAGLKSDGTVVAVGSNDFGQCDVSEWSDIIAITAGDYFTVGLKKDGTLVAAGDNQLGQCEVSGLDEIVLMEASDDALYCCDVNGTVTVLGGQFGFYEFSPKFEILSLSVSLRRTAMLHPDGTTRLLVYMDDEIENFDLTTWSELIKVSAGRDQIAGLRADGTVYAVGYNTYGECDVSEWTNIVDLCAASGYTVGVRADGTVVVTGKYINSGEKCDVSDLNMFTKLIPIEEPDDTEETTVPVETEEPTEPPKAGSAEPMWSDWVTELPAGVDSGNYEIQEKTQYSTAKISSWHTLTDGMVGVSMYDIYDRTEYRTEYGPWSEWTDGTSDPFIGGIETGLYYYSREEEREDAVQYRYRDEIDGEFGEWSAWQFEPVADSATRWTQTRSVYRVRIVTVYSTSYYYRIEGSWSPYSDTPATKSEETAVRTRVVYRYRKLS